MPFETAKKGKMEVNFTRTIEIRMRKLLNSLNYGDSVIYQKLVERAYNKETRMLRNHSKKKTLFSVRSCLPFAIHQNKQRMEGRRK